MRTLLAAALILAGASIPALSQADGNLAPGGMADGAGAKLDAAAGTSPPGRPLADAAAGEGRQAGTSGGRMVKQDGPGDAAKALK